MTLRELFLKAIAEQLDEPAITLYGKRQFKWDYFDFTITWPEELDEEAFATVTLKNEDGTSEHINIYLDFIEAGCRE